MIRPITATDVDAFIAIRREALVSTPAAFGSSPEEDRGLQREFLLEAIANPEYQVMLGAFEVELVGIAGVARQTTVKSRHKALLWGMYVRPGQRGRGVGAALLEAAIATARSMPGVTHLQLTVSSSAPAAARLYRRLGFVTWGTEPAALKVGDSLHDDDHMMLLL